ncbi:MAG: IPT/TIG domain-containing protein, partial [Acidobacteriota bacterium]
MPYPDVRSRRLVLGTAFAISSLAAAGFAGGLPKNTGSAPVLRRTAAAATPRIFAIRPISGPAAGGTAVSIYGLSFAAGATVEIGGVAATGVVLGGTTRIDALAPA